MKFRHNIQAVARFLGLTVYFGWALVVFAFAVACASGIGAMLLCFITDCDAVTGVMAGFAMALPSLLFPKHIGQYFAAFGVAAAMGILIGGILSLFGGSFFGWWAAATAGVLLYACARDEPAPAPPPEPTLGTGRIRTLDEILEDQKLELGD